MDSVQVFEMKSKKGPDNPILRDLIKKLRKKGKELEVDLWSDLAERLNKSNRARSEVNISKINRHTEEGDTVVVPGKVLGSGRLDHSVSVAAFDFSDRARRRIESSQGKVINIEELLEKNPEGEGVMIME